MWCIITAREIGLSPYDGISLSWPPSTEFHKIDKNRLYLSARQLILDYLKDCGREDTRCDPRIVSALSVIDTTLCEGSVVLGAFNGLQDMSSLIFVSVIFMMSNSTSPNDIRARISVPNSSN
jgi:hypothetical protein